MGVIVGVVSQEEDVVQVTQEEDVVVQDTAHEVEWPLLRLLLPPTTSIFCSSEMILFCDTDQRCAAPQRTLTLTPSGWECKT